ncbi:MAG: hypothetical protein NTV34_04685, partial [Proteobacteria bacterium]|nr:hypothetical protein [Pseudomonadota bacterium]
MNRVAWRKLAVDALNTIHYEVNVAMQRSNMSDEFAYFSPDIVFFDDRVANNLNEEELVAMFSKLPLDVPLVVFGPDFKFAR